MIDGTVDLAYVALLVDVHAMDVDNEALYKAHTREDVDDGGN